MRKPDSINRPLMLVLGSRVRTRRETIEPNQAVFAEANGYDRNLWGRIERGLQNVSLSTLGKISAAVGLTMADLLDGIEEEVASCRTEDGASRQAADE